MSGVVTVLGCAVAFENTVRLRYVPPNECIFWATVGVGGHQALVPTLLNFSAGAPTLFPQEIISDSTTAVGIDEWTVSEHIYMFYQRRLRRVDGHLTALHQMTLAGSSLVDDVSVLVRRI